MKNRTENRRLGLQHIVLLILIAMVSSVMTRLVFYHFDVYAQESFPARFSIGTKVGFSADTDRLDFGIVQPGGTSEHEVTLYHEYTRPLKILITSSGTIAPFMKQIAPFMLEPKTSKKVNLIAYGNGKPGNYNGTITILYLKQ